MYRPLSQVLTVMPQSMLFHRMQQPARQMQDPKHLWNTALAIFCLSPDGIVILYEAHIPWTIGSMDTLLYEALLQQLRGISDRRCPRPKLLSGALPTSCLLP